MASPALTTSTAARANAISAPSAVRSPSVTFPATNQARLAWIAPANPVGHPVSGYQYCLAACGVTASWHGTGLTGSIPNAFYRRTALTPGRTYQVLIRAINSAGGGSATAVQFIQGVRASVEIDPIVNSNRGSVVTAYRRRLGPTQSVATGWTGSIAGCRPGTISRADAVSSLSALNYLRAMAHLRPVALDANLSRKSQAAALIMAANQWLDHFPPKSAKCWTADGYDGASHGNLYLGWGYGGGLSEATGPRAMVGYMVDPGDNNFVVGHRRWLMYQSLTRIGLGDTTTSNSVYVVNNFDSPAPAKWVSWPTAGYFPRELEPNGRWSLTLPDADFSAAHVSVATPQGPIAVTTWPVFDGYGDNTLSWNMRLPSAYAASAADYRVVVTVTGIRLSGGQTVSRTWSTTLVRAAG